VDAEVLAALLGGGVAGKGRAPSAGARRRRGWRGEHPDVQRVAHAEVVAADDELVLGPVAEALDQRRPVVVRRGPTLSVGLPTAPGGLPRPRSARKGTLAR
jgi:hypothetical protein